MLRTILLGALLGAGYSHASDINDFPSVEVNGLFGNQAVLTINGEQRLLKRGQRSPEGVLLVSSNLERAVLSYRGNKRTLRLSQRVAGSYQRVEQTAISIAADPMGQYRVQLNVNGQPVASLVDTGASVVAMSSAQADKLGINYLAGQIGQVVTANGRATSYFVTLDEVTLGGIVQRNVPAAVVSGLYPEEVLLGMSFLSSLALAESNGTMSITQQY